MPKWEFTSTNMTSILVFHQLNYLELDDYLMHIIVFLSRSKFGTVMAPIPPLVIGKLGSQFHTQHPKLIEAEGNKSKINTE